MTKNFQTRLRFTLMAPDIGMTVDCSNPMETGREENIQAHVHQTGPKGFTHTQPEMRKVSHTQWCVVSEMNSFTYGGLTCPANHSFCLEATEDFSMGQINILGRMPLDAEISPWWDDTFYEQGTQALVDTMDLVQRIITQTEYHLSQAQISHQSSKDINQHGYGPQPITVLGSGECDKKMALFVTTEQFMP
ncbi:hypothetical protein cypCar_00035666 [Cyprinus carpio]|nr:hypothetical protein cypCar_00035666 [Cyprinus carpio]